MDYTIARYDRFFLIAFVIWICSLFIPINNQYLALATVRVLTDFTCYELNRSTVMRILLATPTLFAPWLVFLYFNKRWLAFRSLAIATIFAALPTILNFILILFMLFGMTPNNMQELLIVGTLIICNLSMLTMYLCLVLQYRSRSGSNTNP